MQPYFYPYLGYFQLLHACDTFVFYDDVNYIKNGWINRNRLLLRGEPHYFTVPLAGASPFARIDETRFNAADTRWRRKMVEMFGSAYRRAPQRDAAVGLLQATLALDTDRIGDLARHSVRSVLDYLGLRRTVRESSREYGNAELSGQARVLDICRREGAQTYINAPGGRHLYNEESFRRQGVELRFLGATLPSYDQGGTAFVPGLSILDVVAWCPKADIARMLAAYELCRPDSPSSPSSS